MSGHDPECEAYEDDPYMCICEPIRAARVDERERIAQAIERARDEVIRALDYTDQPVQSVVVAAFEDAAWIAREGT